MVLAFLFTASIAVQADVEAMRDYSTPTRKLKLSEYPVFSDDQALVGMQTALSRQLDRFSQKDLSGRITLGGRAYPLRLARLSLKRFQQLTADFKACLPRAGSVTCLERFNAMIRRDFHVFAPALAKGDPRFGEEKQTLFTGYHTQPLRGSARPRGEFNHAVYARPSDPRLLKSRGEIDFRGALTGKNLELLYTPSLFELYLVHMEGSGYVTLEDENGTARSFYLTFDGTNKQTWRFISKYMQEKGYISNSSIAAQRKFLRANPQLHEEIFSTCPAYVFFKMSNQSPKGSDLVPVTDGRTLATDKSLYPFKGLLAYVEGERPEEAEHYDFEEEDVTRVKFRPFSRFFLDQDTGGAIKGKARADLYWGKDDYALYAATFLAHTGNIYFLLMKESAARALAL